jgi:hypothetical protein
MSLVERVQSILLKPKQTWPVIAAEGGDVAGIFTRYVMILAAIPAIAGFIGMTLFGIGGFGVTMRIPVAAALGSMIIGYVMSLVMVFVLALIVNALAPTFGGTKDQVAAVKVVAYSMTASFVAGVLGLLPSLAILGSLIGLAWAIYLLYTGLPVLMRSPPEKAGAYTAVVMVCAIVAGIVLAAVSALFINPMGAGGVGGVRGAGAPAGDVTIKGPDGTSVTINPSSMEAMAKKMEEASKRMEAAQQSGDQAAAGKAMGDMLGAMSGNTNTTPIAAADLKALLPEAIGDLKRTGLEASSGSAMGIGGSAAKGTYREGERSVVLSITDSGGLAGMATMAGWASVTMDKETDGKVEKVYKAGSRTIHEEYQKDGSQGEMTVVLANGLIVSAEGERVDMPALKKVIDGVDLARLETLKRPAK